MTGTPTLPTTWNAGDHDAAWPFARLLFAAAQLAYTPKLKALPGFRDIGLDAEFIQERPTQAYAAHAGNDALIAFRGTEDYGDVLTDLTLIRRHTADGALHSGFWDGYDRIHSAVAHFAAKATQQGGRIWLTGHSLGGALAVVAAYRLTKDANLPIGGVVTFGQPMVVTPQLAETMYPLLHDRYVRFVNGRDVFPSLVWPYVHFGQLVLYRHGSFERENLCPPDRAAEGAAALAQGGPGPLLETLDDAQLDALIEELQSQKAMAGDTGDMRMQGMLPWTDDHALAAYSDLVETFVGSASA